MKNIDERLVTFFDRVESNNVVKAIRNGLIMIIPVLLIGAFSLVFQSLPVTVYQEFIKEFAGGFLYDIFTFVYNATFGLLSVFMTFSVSLSFIRLIAVNNRNHMGAVITALICFAVLTGVIGKDFEISAFGVKGMFTALFSALIATVLFNVLWNRLSTSGGINIYSDGADFEFKNSIASIAPATIVALIFAVFNAILVLVLHVSGFQELFINGANALFDHMGSSFLEGLCYVLFSSLLWFFGIHGSDVLEGVSDNIFVPAMEANEVAVATGYEPVHIFTKTFFDVFVLMGGCGASMCLLIAIFISSKRRSNRSLAKMAVFPMVFNISELMTFGLPVIFNPVIFIPFIATPLVVFFVSAAAIQSGLVPMVCHEVQWTTPVILGGYKATGSIAGAVLQCVNLLLGVLIYRPFVKLYDNVRSKQAKTKYDNLVNVLKDWEENNIRSRLTDIPGEQGQIARMISGDMEKMIQEESFRVFYQPQHDIRRRCIGAEALFRWKHDIFGMIYPPLIIKLAEETNHLYHLEIRIIDRAISEFRQANAGRRTPLKLSVNVTVKTLNNEHFGEFLKNTVNKYHLQPGELCIEITEQMALISGEHTEDIIKLIKEKNVLLAIDDFSMGHTSLKYLQDNRFDLVKLDGALVTEIEKKPRSRDIVKSIVHLADSLGFAVLAEYVETEAERDVLEETGCQYYQGYLYSPALPIKEFLEYKNGLGSGNMTASDYTHVGH